MQPRARRFPCNFGEALKADYGGEGASVFAMRQMGTMSVEDAGGKGLRPGLAENAIAKERSPLAARSEDPVLLPIIAESMLPESRGGNVGQSRGGQSASGGARSGHLFPLFKARRSAIGSTPWDFV